jgi:signal transduction histidine kinase
MAEQAKRKKLQDRLRQTNERLLLSAFAARDNAERETAAHVLLQAILSQMPCAVIIVGASSGAITLCNERAQKLWPGCSNVSDMGRYFATNCFHANGRRCTAAELPLRRSIEIGAEVIHQEFSFGQTGGNGTMNIDCGVVRDAKGVVVAAVLACEDITPQKMLKEREENVLLQLRELSAKLEAVREEERTRIAREIHDEVGQSVTGLHLDLNWLQKQLKTSGEAIQERIESMIGETKGIIESVRGLATELRPSILDNLGLIPAIEWHLREFQRRTGVRARFKYREYRQISGESATAVFRIVQEALTNVMRHANAKNVSITLTIERHALRLRITDDGRGIGANQKDSSGLGLVGMRERIRRLGGEFEIGPHRPAGTRLIVSIPLS